MQDLSGKSKISHYQDGQNGSVPSLESQARSIAVLQREEWDGWMGAIGGGMSSCNHCLCLSHLLW